MPVCMQPGSRGNTGPLAYLKGEEGGAGRVQVSYKLNNVIYSCRMVNSF